MQKAIVFIKQAKEELKKVSWPSREQTIRYTLIVIAVSLVVAAFLGFLDLFFSTLIDKFIFE
ncbi:MAG: preprotein translocase subunit SecE [Candidatus Moranbacteria bacterium]|nr:preprotein translocase subunit SecE [Candidatus Moranbacteria bacterium]